MFDIQKFTGELIDESMEHSIKLHRPQLKKQLMTWLIKAKKRPVSDLDQRMNKMNKRINDLVEAMHVRYQKGKLVIEADGSAETTLKMLEFGSDWFEPHNALLGEVISAMSE